MKTTQKQVGAAFKKLEWVLAQVQLETETGTKYTAAAEEFMYMTPQVVAGTTWFAFKHRETRNYLYLSTRDELYIPKTAEPFERGFFGRPGGDL